MEETGISRLPGNLDPQAEEFRPRNPSSSSSSSASSLHTQITLLQPQMYYQYPSSGVPVIPFYQQPSAYFRPNGVPPPPPPPPPPLPILQPPPATASTRSLLLSSVPREVNEETVRRELEVFGGVRCVEMERLQLEGIAIVHFYDLRNAITAVMEIQQQHMHQQNRLRQYYNSWGFLAENSGSGSVPVPVPVPPVPCRGLIAGRAVWAQFISPAMVDGLPDWNNQGTLVVLNLDLGVSACRLKEIFEAFGPVKELRDTPLKKNQRFVEFFDIRDAAKALSEMDGKEINGQSVSIEFSRPGGNRRRISNHNSSTSPPNHNSINGNSFYTRITNYPNPPPPPSPIPLKLFRRSNSNSSSSNNSNASSSHHHHAKKSGFVRGNRRLSSGIETPMGSLSLGFSENGFSSEEGNFNGLLKRSGKFRDNTNNMNNNNNKEKQGMMKQPRARPWKNHNRLMKNSLESYFLIKDDAIMDSNIIRDPRTTVMIKNIPNKYSQKLLLNMLDNHCIHCNEQISDGGDDQQQPLSAYDFVYLPIDFNNKCNVGYGFVNMTSPQATWRLYKAFHLQQWEVFNSRKICEVTYARLQGLESLKEHFKNSKFACETDEYLPVVFSPPRDGGKQLTDPVSIGGHSSVALSNMKILLSSGSGSGSGSNCNNLIGGEGVVDHGINAEMDGEDRRVDGDHHEKATDNNEKKMMMMMMKKKKKKDNDNNSTVSFTTTGGGVGNEVEAVAGKSSLVVPKVVLFGKKPPLPATATATNGCLSSSSEPQQQQQQQLTQGFELCTS